MVFSKKLDLNRSSKLTDLSFFGKTNARQRLIALCILAATPLSSYASVTDGEIKLSIQVKNTSLQQVLDIIENRSDYKFFFNNNQVDTKQLVSVNTEDSDVFEILKRVLKDTDLEYSVMDKSIILAKKSNGKEKRNEIQVSTQTQKEQKITGTVVDQTGEPIIGANVRLKGTTTGTISDFDGNFELSVPTNGTLFISYIGYIPQDIAVNGKSVINVTLLEDTKNLEEVVVTALGIKREEKALGYAVQKVAGDNLASVKTVDVATALTGKVAGLNVKNSSEFNTAPTIQLRGESPLLVIDGVPYGNFSLRDIPADDIESLDVLKGAVASALYGARGGAGAIMVTTKKGNQEGLNIQLNSSTMFNAGYLAIPEAQSGYSTGIGGKYNPADYVWGDKLDIGRTAMQYNPYTYEWEEMPLTSKGKDNFRNFLETGFITNNNINISQKGKYGSFRTSLTHVYNKGQYPNQKLNKITYSVSGDMKFGKLSFEGGAIYNKRFYPNGEGAGYGGGGYIYNMLVWTGTDYDLRDYKNYWIKKDEQQNWMNDVWYDNPYFLAYEQTSKNDYDKVNGYLYGKYDIFPWLNFSIRTGVDAYISRSEWKNPVGARGGWHKNGYFEVAKASGFSINNDALLMAEKKLGDFSVDGFIGATIYYYFDDKVSANTRNGLSIPGFYSLNSSVDPIKASSSYTQKQLNSVYGKFSASWKSAVFVDVTGRNDWSSTLPSETRSYFYPSAAASVVLSEFFENPSWLDLWKVRGSWTVTKNDLGVYATNQAYSIQTNVWNGLNTAIYPSSIRNSLLEPTSSRSYEVGTAFFLLQNKLRFDITYYNKLKYNLTRSAQISATSGFTSTLINYDEEQVRKGVEVSATANIIETKNWDWSVQGNWSRDRYYYSQVDPIYSTQKPWVAAGERWDWYGVYDWERDPNGNIIHNNGYPVKSKYQSVKGFEYPDWIWGLNTHIRYKNISATLSFDGRVGGLAFARTEQAMWNSGSHPDSDNQWRYDEVVNGNKSYIGQGVKVVSGAVEYDTNGNILNDTRVFAPNDTEVSYESYIRTYEPWSGNAVHQNVRKTTFFKLRELSITYSLPNSILEKTKIKGASIGFVGNNLFMWAKEFKYSDPDVDSDNLSSPSMRYLGFNIKLNL